MWSTTHQHPLCVFFAVLACLTLSGCSDDDSVETFETPDNPSTGSGLPVEEPDENQSVGVADTCGTLSVSSRSPSNDSDAPAILLIGEVVTGTVDPDSITNSTHYWSTPVSNDRYRFVLDSRRVDGENASIGLDTEATLEGTSRSIMLTDTDETDRRIRESGLVSVFGSSNLIEEYSMAVTGKFGPQTYHLALLDDQSTVPTPYFVDCPEVNALTLDTTESFVLGSGGAGNDERWFSMNLAAGRYRLAFSSSHRTGIASPINFEVNLFGSLARNQSLSDDELIFDEFGVGHSNIIDLTITRTAAAGGAGETFVRFRNLDDELDVELALTEDNTVE